MLSTTIFKRVMIKHNKKQYPNISQLITSFFFYRHNKLQRATYSIPLIKWYLNYLQKILKKKYLLQFWKFIIKINKIKKLSNIFRLYGTLSTEKEVQLSK